MESYRFGRNLSQEGKTKSQNCFSYLLIFLSGVCKKLVLKGPFTGELYQRKTFYFTLRQLQLMVMEPI